MTITKQRVSAAVLALGALAEAIRALGSVPSGHLYAQVGGYFSADSYERAIATLVRTGLVARSPAHLLTWTGPKLEDK